MTFDYLFAFSVLFFLLLFALPSTTALYWMTIHLEVIQAKHYTAQFLLFSLKKKLHSAFDIHYANIQDTFYAHSKYISGSVPTYEMKKKEKIKTKFIQLRF